MANRVSRKKPAAPAAVQNRAAKPGGAGRRERRQRRVDEPPDVASPAAAGPTGAALEAHVGAQYLVPLLTSGEARGLPGVVVSRVQFQRSALGHPMDDVIVTGHDALGRPATLEIQAKRTVTFTAGDRVFADVVALAGRAARKPEFAGRYELAIAIARTSTRIEQHVQETLRWAREHLRPAEFFSRLNQPGGAHQAMRDFTEAFRTHLRAAGGECGDEDVWRLLARFQVLAFDLEQPGSLSSLLARERCAMLLAPSDAGRAATLWDALGQIALQTDAVGGDLDKDSLRRRLVDERGFRLGGERSLHRPRERLAEMTDHTLAAIETTVHGVRIDRTDRITAVEAALESSRYLEIRGAGGVGKSGVLKQLALRMSQQARVIVVAPNRVRGGGWGELAEQLGCDATAREFLTDLAADGSAMLFIDGLDRFDDRREQATVSDLIRTAALVPGFRVVATARPDFDSDARRWLPGEALRDLGEAPALMIDELSDVEVAQLSGADEALAALFRRDHPARHLVRNLYRLDRLSRARDPLDRVPFSEAEMALQWWRSGDAAHADGRHERRLLLRALALHALTSSTPLDSSAFAGTTIAALVHSGSLRESGDRLELAHDVLRDWALGCLLFEHPEHLDSLALDAPAPTRLGRAVEIAARLHLERSDDATAWQALLNRVTSVGSHGSWRRTVLLAPARTEVAGDVLTRCLPALADNHAALLIELVRTALIVDSQSGVRRWAALGVDTAKFPRDFIIPAGPAWRHLVEWSLAQGNALPHDAVPQVVDLYGRWCMACLGLDDLSPQLVARMHAWLVVVENRNHPPTRNYREWREAQDAPGLSMSGPQEEELRGTFLSWCRLQPGLAQAYLRSVAAHPNRHTIFRPLISLIGTAASAAPRELADLFLSALPEGDVEDRDRVRDLFAHWDLDYFPASPARKPFLDLLDAHPEEGLRLVRGVLAHAVKRRARGQQVGDNRIVIPFSTGTRAFHWIRSYTWSRDHDSHIVASALMALEAWAHRRVERGEPIERVIADVLGPDGSPLAVVLVAIDVLISHWPESRAALWPFAASARLLALDRQRYAQDHLDRQSRPLWVRPEPVGGATLDSLRGRGSRLNPLDAVVGEYGQHGPDDVRLAMRNALLAEVRQLGDPDEDSDLTDPRFAAMSALNLLDPANYSTIAGEDGTPVVVYTPPRDEAELRRRRHADVTRNTVQTALYVQLAQAIRERTCDREVLSRGIAWATGSDGDALADLNADDVARTRLIVAALVLRDGSEEDKLAHRAWALALLLESATSTEPEEPFRQFPFNTASIAATGLLVAQREGVDQVLRPLLELAARRDAGMAAVLDSHLKRDPNLDSRLVHSLVRLGLTSTIVALAQPSEDGPIETYRERLDASEQARRESEARRLGNAVGAELAWLGGHRDEPVWPVLPQPLAPRPRSVIRLGGESPPPRRRRAIKRSFVLDQAAASQWISLASALWAATAPDTLRGLLRHCWAWTADANGMGCEPDEEPAESVHNWNDAYFKAAVHLAVSVPAYTQEVLLDPVIQLPEARFFDAIAAVIHGLDLLWLQAHRVEDAQALSIRQALAQRFLLTRGWKWHEHDLSHGAEMHLADALAALFAGHVVPGQGPRCYVPPEEAHRLHMLVPLLADIAQRGAASTYVAIAFMEAMTVRPVPSHLPLMSRVVSAWHAVHAESADFWVDHRVGQRVCEWIDGAAFDAKALKAGANHASTVAMVDLLLRCGIHGAVELDDRLKG